MNILSWKFTLLLKILGYRKKVVLSNLSNSFPHKSEEEIKNIANDFYRYFGRLLAESLKLFSINKAILSKRVSFKNDSSIPGHESKSVSINIEDENRWEVQSGAENITSGNYIDFASFNENVSQADYEAMTRSCLKLDELRVSWAEDVLPYDIDLRYNFGYNNYEAEVLDCRDLDSIDPLHIFFLVYPTRLF